MSNNTSEIAALTIQVDLIANELKQLTERLNAALANMGAVEAPKKKRVYKKKTEAAEGETSANESAVEEAPKKKRVYKKKEAVPEGTEAPVEEAPKKKRVYKKKTEEVVAPPADGEAPVEEPKKKRVYKKKAEVVPEVVPEGAAPEGESKKKRVYKKKTEAVVVEEPKKAEAVEEPVATPTNPIVATTPNAPKRNVKKHVETPTKNTNTPNNIPKVPRKTPTSISKNLNYDDDIETIVGSNVDNE
jgi:hypothetical protein